MKIDGSCHCGAIAYEAEIDPETVGICHCADCQQLTGTAFRVSVFAPEDKFRLTRGTPKVSWMRWYLTAFSSTAPSPSWPVTARWISCHGVCDAGYL